MVSYLWRTSIMLSKIKDLNPSESTDLMDYIIICSSRVRYSLVLTISAIISLFVGLYEI